MRAIFTLVPAESKRLIAKAVVELPEVKHAYNTGRMIIPRGTTNAFIVEELLGIYLEIEKFAGGLVTEGVQCITSETERLAPFMFEFGTLSTKKFEDLLAEFTADDVFIKGANAIDNEGNVRILLAYPDGSTIGKAIGYLAGIGSHLIIPVGLEKMIPSVKKAIGATGIKTFDLSLGKPVGLMQVNNGKVITEIEALNILAGVKATCIASGGIGGSEGAVVLSIEGEKQEVEKAFRIVKNIKGEPGINIPKQLCPCNEPCDFFY